MSETAIYAGTFDPMTLGHVDVLERASKVFPSVLVAVVRSPRKHTMFSAEERIQMAGEVAAEFGNVKVQGFEGLLVEFAKSQGMNVLVRGLRAFSDFEYEFQMALMNRKLDPTIETMFLMPKETYSYVSSSAVREVAELGGNVAEFVPACVLRHIGEYVKRLKSRR